MNLKFLTNQRSVTGGDVFLAIKTFLVGTAGWTVVASGNGASSFSTSGTDFVTTVAIMQTAQAWYVLKAPTGTFQLLVQCQGATHRVYRAKVSPVAGFVSAPLNSSGVVTGSISATSCPSATDQLILCGNSDDTATNAGIVTAFGADASYMLHGFADLSAPYGFLFWTAKNNNPACTFAFMLDPITGGLSGDPDPWVAYLGGTGGSGGVFSGSPGTGGFIDETNTSFNTPMSWIARTFATVVGGRVPAASFMNGTTPISPGSHVPVYGSESCPPVPYMRRAAMPGGGGFKGYSTLLKWRGTTGRFQMDTPSQASIRDSVVLEDVITFWDGSNPLF